MGNGLGTGGHGGVGGGRGAAAGAADPVVAGKNALRRPRLAARATLPRHHRAVTDAALLRNVVSWVSGAADARAAGEVTVAAHVPMGDEPGATAMAPAELLAALAGTIPAESVRLLLPVCPPGPPAALDWAEFAVGSGVAPGKYGILEPVGPRLGAGAIRRADLLIVPGVAADRAGMRMGRGAGYYDRSLALARATTPTAVILHPGELVDAVPHDAHDLPVDAIITADGITRPPR